MTIHIGRTTIIAALAVLAAAAIALRLLPPGAVLTLAVVLACPVMMLFMHRGGAAERGERSPGERRAGATRP